MALQIFGSSTCSLIGVKEIGTPHTTYSLQSRRIVAGKSFSCHQLVLSTSKRKHRLKFTQRVSSSLAASKEFISINPTHFSERDSQRLKTALLLRGGTCNITQLKESVELESLFDLNALRAALAQDPAFQVSRQKGKQTVSLVQTNEVELPLCFQRHLAQRGKITYLNFSKGVGFVRTFHQPPRRVFLSARLARGFSVGDVVSFSAGLAFDGRRCVNAIEHHLIERPPSALRESLFPPLKAYDECSEELELSGAPPQGQLLCSFGVDKQAQRVVDLSSSDQEGRERWEPRYNTLVELNTPLVFHRTQTLKAMQRVGLPLVLGAARMQAVQIEASPRVYDVVCFRRTLASLMDVTLDPSYEAWFALDTFNSISQLQKVSFLVKKLKNGTILIDEGFQDSALLMNADSFGRQFERTCVIKPMPHVKPFQAYEIPLSKTQMLVFTPPDAMTRDHEPVEIKLRLPPLRKFTDREEFFKGLTNLRHIVLGFGRKLNKGKKLVVDQVTHHESEVHPELMLRYSDHLENVLQLIQQHATNPSCTYIMRRKAESIVFSEIDNSTFIHENVPE